MSELIAVPGPPPQPPREANQIQTAEAQDRALGTGYADLQRLVDHSKDITSQRRHMAWVSLVAGCAFVGVGAWHALVGMPPLDDKLIGAGLKSMFTAWLLVRGAVFLGVAAFGYGLVRSADTLTRPLWMPTREKRRKKKPLRELFVKDMQGLAGVFTDNSTKAVTAVTSVIEALKKH